MIGLANYAALKARAAGPADWRKRLRALGPCAPAWRWVRRGKFASWQACWQACSRVDWLCWAAVRLRGRVGACGTDGCINCVLDKEGMAGLRRLFPIAPPLPEVRK